MMCNSIVLSHQCCKVVACTQQGPKKSKSRRITPLISYEAFQWTWFIVLTVLAIVDRFTWNVWPRQTYSIGSGSAGSDRLEGFKPGPWSVVLYDCLARISGRYAILSYNFLLLTRLESLEWILTNSFISKYILDCSNIVNANIRLHTYTGIGLCVLTLLHVWSILFPCVVNGYSAVIVPGNFEWPLSERTPVKCSVEDVPGCWPGDANPETKTMGLQVDDVFRMVEMTIFLGILLPLSVKWLTTRWHAAIQLHRVINLVYFVDIVRRHSHPHSWILNTPMFCLYLCDKILWSKFWRRNASPQVKKLKLGQDFMVVYWKSPFGFTDTIGPDYALRLKNSSFLEEKHVFTCFQNRTLMGDSAMDDADWTIGAVIRVFRRRRVPRLGIKDAYSHTMRIFEQENPDMVITGPRQGEMSEMIKNGLLTDDSCPLVLLGAGSAVNFIIDCLQWCHENKPRRSHVIIVYTTRDHHLFKWSQEIITNLLPLCERKSTVFDVRLAFTGDTCDSFAIKGCTEESLAVEEARTTRIKTLFSRIDFIDVIDPGSLVFCQGSGSFKNAAAAVCKEIHAKFHGGRGGS